MHITYACTFIQIYTLTKNAYTLTLTHIHTLKVNCRKSSGKFNGVNE